MKRVTSLVGARNQRCDASTLPRTLVKQAATNQAAFQHEVERKRQFDARKKALDMKLDTVRMKVITDDSLSVLSLRAQLTAARNNNRRG